VRADRDPTSRTDWYVPVTTRTATAVMATRDHLGRIMQSRVGEAGDLSRQPARTRSPPIQQVIAAR
jgi:hypothetical protein